MTGSARRRRWRYFTRSFHTANVMQLLVLTPYGHSLRQCDKDISLHLDSRVIIRYIFIFRSVGTVCQLRRFTMEERQSMAPTHANERDVLSRNGKRNVYT